MAMKEIVEELTVTSERFLRVWYTVRVGAPLVGLRWLGHYYLHKKDHGTLKVHASNQNYTYIVRNRYRKCLQKLLWACCTGPNKQVLYFTEVWTFFTDTALHQKYGYPEPAFWQVENVRKKLQWTQQKVENMGVRKWERRGATQNQRLINKEVPTGTSANSLHSM